MKLTVCDTKVLYDTEFEAVIAAAKKTYNYGEEMEPYKCFGAGGVSIPHYHLTHVHTNQRRGAGQRHARCPDCGEILKKSTIRKGHKCQ